MVKAPCSIHYEGGLTSSNEVFPGSVIEDESSATTTLVMAAIADEVQRRINTEKIINVTYLLHSIENIHISILE